jgi:hypothetical protein
MCSVTAPLCTTSRYMAPRPCCTSVGSTLILVAFSRTPLPYLFVPDSAPLFATPSFFRLHYTTFRTASIGLHQFFPVTFTLGAL